MLLLATMIMSISITLNFLMKDLKTSQTKMKIISKTLLPNSKRLSALYLITFPKIQSISLPIPVTSLPRISTITVVYSTKANLSSILSVVCLSRTLKTWFKRTSRTKIVPIPGKSPSLTLTCSYQLSTRLKNTRSNRLMVCGPIQSTTKNPHLWNVLSLMTICSKPMHSERHSNLRHWKIGERSTIRRLKTWERKRQFPKNTETPISSRTFLSGLEP